MKNKIFIAVSILTVLFAQNIFAQISKKTASASVVSETFKSGAENQERQQASEVSRERRAQAYAKLLEGQRYIWSMLRVRSQAANASYSKLAKQALQQSVELDPTLAEAYTALANLAKNTPPYDVDESIMFASIAVKIDRNNFGAHQILAQLYTYKSNLNRETLDAAFAQKAIVEWNEIARLDARNAEAFAFLNEFYGKTNKNAERIAALKNWLAAATPISDGFYGRVYQGETLAPQAAAVKLGQVLLEDKQTREAVEILSRAVADEPENTEAIGLLRSALELADKDTAQIAVQSLQQAIYANPQESALPILLAQIQSKSGKIDDAVKVLSDASARFAENDKSASADLQVALADIYGKSNRIDEAAAGYQNALTLRGIVVNKEVLPEKERRFVIEVFEKIISLYTKANRPNEAKAATERAKLLLGK